MGEKKVIEKHIRIHYKEYWIKRAAIKNGEEMDSGNSFLREILQAKIEALLNVLIELTDKETSNELLRTIRKELRATSTVNLGLTTEEKQKLIRLLSYFPIQL